jgi:HlyD family secretion protein
MTANCTFVYAQRDDALRVANAALRFLPPPALLAKLHPEGAAGKRQHRGGDRSGDGAGPGGGGEGRPGRDQRDPKARNAASDQRTVWVMRNGKPQPVHIKIGMSDGSLTEVASGDLNAGDTVLTGVTMAGTAATTARPAQGAQGAGNLPRRLF